MNLLLCGFYIMNGSDYYKNLNSFFFRPGINLNLDPAASALGRARTGSSSRRINRSMYQLTRTHWVIKKQGQKMKSRPNPCSAVGVRRAFPSGGGGSSTTNVYNIEEKKTPSNQRGQGWAISATVDLTPTGGCFSRSKFVNDHLLLLEIKTLAPLFP